MIVAFEARHIVLTSIMLAQMMQMILKQGLLIHAPSAFAQYDVVLSTHFEEKKETCMST